MALRIRDLTKEWRKDDPEKMARFWHEASSGWPGGGWDPKTPLEMLGFLRDERRLGRFVAEVDGNIVAYCDSISTNGQRMWSIEIQVQNTGSGTSVIDGVFLNDQTIPSSPSPPTKGLASTDLQKSGASLSGGERYKFKVLIHNQCGTLSPGTMVSVKIHTAAGANYIQTIQLS